MSVAHSTPLPLLVYFIRFGVAGPIKIGRSEASLARRFSALQYACPEELFLIAVIRDASDDLELGLHKAFSAHRIRGEWFHPEADLLRFIGDHAEPIVPPIAAAGRGSGRPLKALAPVSPAIGLAKSADDLRMLGLLSDRPSVKSEGVPAKSTTPAYLRRPGRPCLGNRLPGVPRQPRPPIMSIAAPFSRARRGRVPDRLKPEIFEKQERFIRFVLSGEMLVREAAAAAGVARRTMSRWVAFCRDARPDESADN